MFKPSSRYYALDTAMFVFATGRTLTYVRRRFLPIPRASAVLAEHLVTEGDRLDNVTARYLGDPELFWQLADVNNAMRPEELTAEIGRRLVLAAPES